VPSVCRVFDMFGSQQEKRVIDASSSAAAVDLFRPADGGVGIRSSDVVRFIHDTYHHGRRPPTGRISNRSRRNPAPGLSRFGTDAFICPPPAESATRVQLEGRRAHYSSEKSSARLVAQDILEALDSFIHPPSGARISAIQDHVVHAGAAVQSASTDQGGFPLSPSPQLHQLGSRRIGDFTFGRTGGHVELPGRSTAPRKSVVPPPSCRVSGLASEFWAECVRSLVSRVDPERFGSMPSAMRQAKGHECALYLALCNKYGVEPQEEVLGRQTDASDFWADRVRRLYFSVESNVDVDTLLNKFAGQECALYIATARKFGLAADPFAEVADSLAPAVARHKASTPVFGSDGGSAVCSAASSQSAAKRRRT